MHCIHYSEGGVPSKKDMFIDLLLINQLINQSPGVVVDIDLHVHEVVLKFLSWLH